MAVTNSAVDSSWTWWSTQAAGTIVRYGSSAKPRTSQATVQAATRAPPCAEPANRPWPPAGPIAPVARMDERSPARRPGCGSCGSRAQSRRPLHRPRPSSGPGWGCEPSIAHPPAAVHPRQRAPTSTGRRSVSGAPPSACPIASRSEAAGRSRRPGTSTSSRPRVDARHDGTREAEPRRLAQPPLEPGTPAAAHPEAHLAEATVPVPSPAGRGATTRGRSPSGRSMAGSAGQPAGEVHVDVVRPGRSRRAAEDGERAAPAGSGRCPRPCAAARSRRGDQRLDLDEHGPACLPARRDDTTRGRARRSARNAPRRIGDLAEPALAHLEHAHLVGRPEAVLGRAQQAERRVPLALQVEHDVDQVLQRLRPGEAAVLGHVADEDHRHVPRPSRAPCSRAAASRTWPTLPAGPSSSSACSVWTSRPRAAPAVGARPVDDAPDVGLGEDVYGEPARPVEQAEPRRARSADLRRRLLARDVEHALPARVRGPPPPGAAASTCRCRARRRAAPASRHDPAAEDAVDSPMPDRRRGGPVGDVARASGAGRAAAGRRARRRRARGLANERLDQGVPGAARAALPFPAQEGRAARWQT